MCLQAVHGRSTAEKGAENEIVGEIEGGREDGPRMAEGRKSNQGEDAQMSRAAAQTGVPESGKRGVMSSAPCPKLQLGMPNVKWIGTPNNPDASCQPSQCEGKRPSKLLPEAQGEKTPSRRPDGWAGS